MPTDNISTTEYFSSQVERFSTQYRRKACFQDRLRLFLEAVHHAAGAPGRVLDFGCGPGIMSAALGERGYDVLGIDGAAGMVEMARATAVKFNLMNVRFEQMDAATLDVPPESFDVVVCSSVIEYIEDDLGLLRKLTRALKPGGCLVISMPHTGSLLGQLEGLLRSSKRFLSRERSRHLAYTLRRYNRSQLLRQLGDIGLESFDCTTFEFPFFGNMGVSLSRYRCLGRMLLIAGRKSISGERLRTDSQKSPFITVS